MCQWQTQSERRRTVLLRSRVRSPSPLLQGLPLAPGTPSTDSGGCQWALAVRKHWAVQEYGPRHGL